MSEGGVSRISISLPPALLKSFNEAWGKAGFKDRSKAIQMAMRSFITEHLAASEQKGKISGVILLAYDPEVRGLEKLLVEAQHEERRIISSSVHNHLDERNCLEAVMVHGDASRVRELSERLAKQRGVKYLRTISFQTSE